MTLSTSLSTIVMPAEWERQDAIMLAWPHFRTDWQPMLEEAQECFLHVAEAILRDERLIVITPCVEQARKQLATLDNGTNILYQEIETNDTWARDFGPISIYNGTERILLDFKFDGWGMKFAACHDNMICRRLYENELFNANLVTCQDFVLEGGSIESDGKGTLLTTSNCLLSPNRNASLSKDEIENVLKTRLGAKKVMWLNNGNLIGDDTDSHIDTLARLAPGNTIIYVKCDDPNDKQYDSLKRMEQELQVMTDASSKPFNLVPLPCPKAIYDKDGMRLPATYANFLITNTQVLVPTYGQPKNDEQALAIINNVFSDRTAVGIDCSALIKQHGSLHCITMQIPENFLK